MAIVGSAAFVKPQTPQFHSIVSNSIPVPFDVSNMRIASTVRRKQRQHLSRIFSGSSAAAGLRQPIAALKPISRLNDGINRRRITNGTLNPSISRRMSSYPGLFSGGVPTPVVDQAYEAGQREKQGSGITQPGFASGSAAGQPVQLGGSSGQPAGHDLGRNKGTGHPYAGQLQQPPSAAGVGAGGMGGAGIRGGGTGSTGGAVTSHGTGYFNPDRASLGNRLPQIIEAVRQLYSCEPADHIFTQFYAPDSKFEDPLGRLEGIDNVRLAFKGLAEVLEFKGFDRFECVDATSEGLRFEIVCHYRLKPIGPNIPFRCTTIIRLDPASHYIIDHTDDWMGVPLMTPENAGWVGRLAQLRRKVTGAMQAAFVKATGGDKIMAGT